MFAFPTQVNQVKTQTEQNLQKEMQKMQQKFKAREDKARKEHREEMGQVCVICVSVSQLSGREEEHGFKSNGLEIIKTGICHCNFI